MALLRRLIFLVGLLVLAGVVAQAWILFPTFGQSDMRVDLLLINARVLDGTGNPWFYRDIGITGDRIRFVGDAGTTSLVARETLDLNGLLVTPGFWDAHSHADLESEQGRQSLPQLYQGITTVVLGVDGGGSNRITQIFDRYRKEQIAVNALRYVGHGAARRQIMGVADRAPEPGEMDRMKQYVAQGLGQGAIGLSTGLFYSPGYFADTEEVVELAKVAARYNGSYDTHDRDLGVAYKGIGYLNSIREAIEIGERAQIPVIFSHFNAQGIQNYGRAAEGAELVEEARARGVNVMAAQHVYTATHSSLRAYAIPRWAFVGGRDEMLKRFRDSAIHKRLYSEISEMIEMRGGAAKLLFTDSRPHLNGRTLADVTQRFNQTLPESVIRILSEGNAGVMNLDLYDMDNTEYLAQKEWMMTCTDGGTPAFGEGIVHPRSYGAFPRKIRLFVHEKKLISLPFAVRGMTSLASSFYGIEDRGLIRPGSYADIAVWNEKTFRDKATYDDPHQYAEGVVHVLVNGQFALRDGKPTAVMAGRPIPRPL